MKKIVRQAIKYLLLITVVLLSIIDFSLVTQADGQSHFTGQANIFTRIEMKEGGEEGTLVYDYVNDSSNGSDGKINSSKIYYLMVEADDISSLKESGKDLYARVTLGKKDGESVSINGLWYRSIPGSTFQPGTISSDSFDELISYDNAPAYSYTGGNLDVKDGTLLYKMNAAKTSMNMTIAFEFNRDYWVNEDIINQAFHIELGTYEDGVFTSKSGFDGDVQIGDEKKVFSVPNTGANCFIEKDNYPCFTLSGANSVLLYDEMSYDITYPSDAGIQLSVSNNSITNSAAEIGNMVISEPIVNEEDGTSTYHVTLTNGCKWKTNHAFVFLHIKPGESKYHVDDQIIVTCSNFSVTPRGSSSLVLLSGDEKSEMTITMKEEEKIVDEEKLALSSVDRNPTGGYVGGYVYNWNIGRDETSYVNTSQFIGGALIQNTGTLTSKVQQLNAFYNTTGENAIVNFITIPVGTYKDSSTGKDVTKPYVDVHWTGIKEDGSESSGTTICYTRSGTRFTILKTADCGEDIVSIKQISVEIGQLTGGYSSGSANASIYDINCGAFGYFNDSSSGAKIYHTFELVGEDGTKRTTTASVTSGSRLAAPFDNRAGTYGVTSSNLHYDTNGHQINGGDTLTLTNQLLGNSSLRYVNRNPTSNTTVNPVVYITLPKNFSYSDLSFQKQTVGLGDYTSENPTSSAVLTPLEYSIQNVTYKNKENDGVTIYKVTFKDRDLVLGYYDAEGNETFLNMSVTLNTAKSTTSKTYAFNDFFHVTSETGTVCLGPGWGDSNMGQSEGQTGNISYNTEDLYDLNGGNALSKGGKGNPGESFLVQRLSSLTVDSAIRVTKINDEEIATENQSWETYDPNNPNSIVFLGLKSEGEYRIHIENPSSSTAKEMMLIVPIPKKNADFGNVFMNAPCQFSMNMTLDTDSLPEGFTYKYVKLDDTYDQLSDVTYAIENLDSVTAEEANAFVLIGSESVEDPGVLAPKGSIELLFNYTIDQNDDETLVSGEQNVWRNALEYRFDDSMILNGETGSYVASEVAASELNGLAFLDENNNGVQDTGEKGLAGITVTACDSKGRIQDTVTDEDGNYHFTQVREDNVTITLTAPRKSTAVEDKDKPVYGFFKDPIEINSGIVNHVKPEIGNKSASATVSTVGESQTVNAAVGQICTVSYTAGGAGGIAPASKDYPMGSNCVIANIGSSLDKTGYGFTGWKDLNTNTIVQPGNSFTVTKDTTFEAQWAQNQYTISFDYQGGTSTPKMPTSLQMVYGNWLSDLNATWPDNPTKDGWTFVKWEVDEGQTLGTGKSIDSVNRGWNNAFYYAKDITANAVFSKLSKTSDEVNTTIHTTTTTDVPLYDFMNHVSVLNDSNDTSKAVTYTVKEGSTLPEGIVLNGSKITGTPTTAGDYPVTFVIKGNNDSTFEYVLTIHVAKLPVTSIVQANPAHSAKLDGGSVSISLQTTLSGIETANVEKIEYYIDDTLVGTIDKTSEGGVVHPFVWSLTTAGTYKVSTKVYPDSSIYDITYTNIDTYVVSEGDVYEHPIHFDLQEDTLIANAVKPTIEDSVGIENQKYGTLPNPKVDGYSFDGWYTEETYVNKVEADTLVNLGNNENEQTLYAKWTEKTYHTKFMDSIDTATAQLVHENTNQGYYFQVFTSYEPSRTGYTFTGWSFANEATLLNQNATYKDLALDTENELTFYANWNANKYTVTYNATGGSVEHTSKTVTYDQNYGSLDTAYRNGYQFDGWYTAETGGDKITSSDKVSITDAQTLYAHWTEKTYTVSYDTRGGTSCANKTVTYSDSGLLPFTNPTKEGYTFKNWTYDSAIIDASQTYGGLAGSDNISSITLIAQWDVNLYSVTYESGSGYEIVAETGFSSPVNYNDQYQFKVHVDSTYDKSEMSVFVNGTEITADTNGIYTIDAIVENKTITVTGLKRVITIPFISNLPYNGSLQKPSITETDDYSVTTNNGGTNVGNYSVTLTLKNPATTVWENDTEQKDDVTISYAITKATNEFTTALSCADITYGGTLSPSAVAKFGTVTYKYATEETGTYSETIPSTVGSYYVKAYIEGTDNYTGLESDPVAFNIAKTTGTTIPDTVTALDETIDGKHDGKISGLNSTMEYKKEGALSWTKITGTEITNLEPGTYTVRVAETSTSSAGEGTDFTIGTGIKLVLTFDDGTEELQTYSLSWHQGIKDIDSLPTVSEVTGYIFDGWYSAANGSGTKYINADNSITDAGNNVQMETDTTIYLNQKRIVEKPAITDLSYNGSLQKPSITETDDYSVTTNNGGTNVGNYSVTLTLKNPATTVWENDTEQKDDVTISYAITKATNEFTTALSCADITYGGTLSPSAVAKFGTVTYKYATEETGTYSETIPSTVGSYYVKAYVEGTDNYTGLESDPVAFEITRKSGDVIPSTITVTGETISGKKDGSISGLNNGMEYSTDGITWTHVTGSSLSNLSAGSYYIRHAKTDTTAAGEMKEFTISEGRKIILTFQDGNQKTYECLWHQTLADITLPTLPEKDGYVFDGGYSEPNGSGIKYIDANEDLTHDGTNLQLENDVTIYANWTPLSYGIIKPTNTEECSITPVNGSTEPINYNGSYSFKVNLKPGYKGTNLQVTVNGHVLAPDENDIYHITNIVADQEIQVTGIEKVADPEGYIQIDDLTWDEFNEVKDFDIYKQNVSVVLQGGVSTSRNLQYYLSSSPLTPEQVEDLTDEQWETYTVPVPLTKDGSYIVYMKYSNSMTTKYASSDGIILDTTLPTISINGIAAQDTTYTGISEVKVHDENLEKFTINGIVQDLDESSYSLTPSNEPYVLKAMDKAGNTKTSTIRIDYEYVTPPELENLYFNGEEQVPSLMETDDYRIRSFEEGIHVGSYQVQLTLKHPTRNKWKGEESDTIILSYQIQKGQNSWIQELICESIDEEQEVSPKAIGKYGDVTYVYSDESNGTYNTEVPTKPGKYYVKAMIPGTEDYDVMESTAVEFEIRGIIPPIPTTTPTITPAPNTPETPDTADHTQLAFMLTTFAFSISSLVVLVYLKKRYS